MPIDSQIWNRCRKEQERFLDLYFESNTHFNAQQTLAEVDHMIVNGYFAGGAFASMILGHEPRDWDIFIRDKNALERVKAWLLDQPHMVKAATDRAITLRGGYQVITCRWGDPEYMTNKVFDFQHTRGYYTFSNARGGSNLHIPREVYLACKYKRLLPLRSVDKLDQYRIDKFEARGWTLDQGELEGLDLLRRTQL